MKQLIIGMIASLLSVGALADPLALEKRQPDTAMNVTSLELGDDESVINAEGDMGVYGRVYVDVDVNVLMLMFMRVHVCVTMTYTRIYAYM